MTTKPKARRFRLRLGDDPTGALRTAVAPQPGATPGANEGPSATRPSSTRDPGAQPSRPQPPRAEGPAQPANRSPERGARPVPDALFDEESGPTRPAPTHPAARNAPRPAPRPAAAQPPAQDRPADTSAPRPAQPVTPAEADIDTIRDSELTGRQLRMAMRVAQRNGIKATSGIEAVRLLRKRGIDPFERSTLLDLAKDETPQSRALTTTEPAQPQLPKTYRQPSPPAKAEPGPGLPSTEVRKMEVSRIQHDIARRRRRRMTLLATRLLVFVGLPTLIAAFYFYVLATPLYATNSEFIVQQADSGSSAGAGALAGMFGGAGLSSNNDSRAVQSYLQSRDAMRRLDAEQGFKAYFQGDNIDPLRRLAPDSTDEAAYRLYESMVQVSYDPTEGIIRMEVIAADPATSERFARALISYAEEQVDQLTQRVRENQMRDAQQHVANAEQEMRDAQQRVLDLQERTQMLSSEVEVTLLTQQITQLESQLNNERLSLADLEANARPNPARLEQAQRRVASLEERINQLRNSLTQGSNGEASVAQLQREQTMAQADVATRQMLLAQAMQQLEAARVEANRQVRYLSLGVTPVAPDEPTYPRAFADTALAFLIFAGIYLMISMTSAILREQVTG